MRDHLTDFYFAHNLPHTLFEDLLRQTLSQRVPPQDIVPSIHTELAPLGMLFTQGEAYEALEYEERVRVEHHLEQIKVVLIKAMISDHLEYIGIAKEWFDIADLQAIRVRWIGSGKIGGKAAGVMLAECVLRKSSDWDFLQHLCVPQSWFLGADMFYQFAELNGLHVHADQKYKSEAEIRADYPTIQDQFREGRLPDEIVEGLRMILERVVGRLNRRLNDETFILLGPGRWGSNNPDLGIPVTYSEIHNARALVEIADDETAPEPSYGTHFFQDMVEAQIYPLALALNDPEAEFALTFFEKSDNVLTELLPDDADWEGTIRVIDIPTVSGGAYLDLAMDGDAGIAMAYLRSEVKGD